MSGSYYNPVHAVTAMHEAPRFGHTKDISVLITNEFDTSIDYYLGLLGISSIISLVYFVWWAILIVLKILGWRVGCASGRAFQMNSPKDFEPVAQRIVKIRIAFLFFGLILISSSLSVILNSTRVKDIFESFNANASTFAKAIEEPAQYSEQIADTVEKTIPRQDSFVMSLRNFCPEAMNDTDIHSAVHETIDAVDSLGDLYQFEIRALHEGLTSTKSLIDTKIIQTFSSDNIDLGILTILSLNIGLILLTCILVGGVILSGMPIDSPFYGIFTHVQTWVLYPLMFVLVGCTWVGACGSSILAIMTADFCFGGGKASDGPAQTITNMVLALDDVQKSNMAYESMSYITHGCNTENPLRFLNDFQNKIQKAQFVNDEFLSVVTQLSYEEMGEACVDNKKTIFDESISYGNDLDVMMETIKDVKMSLNCDVLKPIWDTSVEETVCTEGANSLLWTFYSFLVVLGCGMSTLLVRAARNDVEVTFSEDEHEHDLSWRSSPKTLGDQDSFGRLPQWTPRPKSKPVNNDDEEARLDSYDRSRHPRRKI